MVAPGSHGPVDNHLDIRGRVTLRFSVGPPAEWWAYTRLGGDHMPTIKAQFSFTVQDGLGTKASLALYALLDDTTTAADLDAQWQAYAADLTAVIDAKIIGGSASLVLAPTASQAGKPTTGSRVEQNALLGYVVTASGRRFSIATPGWKDSLISGGQIVLTGAAATWIAALTGALGVATGDNTSNDFLALGAATDAVLVFRKHRRQLSRSSFEAE